MNRRVWRRRGEGDAMNCIVIVALIAFVFVIGFSAEAEGFREGFREGQIGALSGNDIRYELVEQPEGSKTWELIEKP